MNQKLVRLKLTFQALQALVSKALQALNEQTDDRGRFRMEADPLIVVSGMWSGMEEVQFHAIIIIIKARWDTKDPLINLHLNSRSKPLARLI